MITKPYAKAVHSKDLSPEESAYFPKGFWKTQVGVQAVHPPKDTNLSGQVAIVTGSNTGIGYEAAKQLLSFQLSYLIVAVRSVSKGEQAAKVLRESNPRAKVEVWELDMASYESITAFSNRCKAELTRLDIAILNAGRNRMTYNVVGTGHEEIIQVNYLSTVLLSMLLLPILRDKSPAGVPGRLTIAGSGTSLTAAFPSMPKASILASLDDPTAFEHRSWYSRSKLFLQAWLIKIVEHVSADDVIVNIADPGFTLGTEFVRDAPRLAVAIIGVLLGFASRSIPDAASAYLDGALLKGKESHGDFLMAWKTVA
jgi:NAD(P)-dependent dehydrogenase (short-subunit alcohol dehydrogenase family)